MSFGEIVDYMVEKECVNVFNFATAVKVYRLLQHFRVMKNLQFSIGLLTEMNALIAMLFYFMAEAEEVEGSPVQKLHMYPDMKEGYGTKVMLLENGKMNFRVEATDENYHAVPLDMEKIEFQEEGGIGELSSDGLLTAAAGCHEGKATAKVKGTDIKTSVDVKVVDSITKLVADRSILSVAPSKTTKLTFEAENNGVPVLLTSEALTFKLSDDSLGTISRLVLLRQEIHKEQAH